MSPLLHRRNYSNVGVGSNVNNICVGDGSNVGNDVGVFDDDVGVGADAKWSVCFPDTEHQKKTFETKDKKEL